MTEHEHAAAGTGPGPGPRPTGDAGPRDAAPGAGAAPGARATPGAGATVGPDAPGPPHRFRRDRRHKMVAGVCAGLGRQCDMDPVIFRITLAVLSATGGLGLLFYGFAWLFVPSDDEDENEVRKLLTGRVDGQALAAVLFALVGCGVFLTMLHNGGVLTFAVVLSLLLAGAGYWSRQRGAPGPDPLAAQAVADAPPEAQAPPVTLTWPSWWRDPIVKDGSHFGGTGYLWGPSDARPRDISELVDVRLAGHGIPRTRPEAPRPRPPVPRGPRGIGGPVFLLALAAGALGTRAAWGEHALGPSLQTGLACALVVFGLGIAVSSFLGRTGAGSVFLAVLTAGLLTASAALPRDIGTEWARVDWAPASADQVRARYDVGMGVGTLDLSRLDLDEGQTVTTRAETGLGRIRVVVPPDVTVRLDVSVGLGDIQLPGDDEKDVDVAPDKHQRTTLSPAGGGKGTGTLDLGMQVGLGQVEVSRAAS
ncbi:PspC domain-containing protein [Streptomyces griseoviridis]|uniref:Phage shock protein PspC (Stress-responsive transcriptional regulator) n=1 Tax=Streptomyces griseoviridis TaxID=45398 RepID=A0ABT9LKZ1_STRGD|nr:PspC domain-containing protein [Streptomyces griseoviridis]MDP9683617.1 phage shock protein PspC (stress-responsive transcriptional regulator) [Streptomyces griseoviridis]GGS93611.1 membrane protein [Streptomyces griseoviridis]